MRLAYDACCKQCVSKILLQSKLGAGVGKIVDHNDQPLRWNYNYDISPLRSLVALVTYWLANAVKPVEFLYQPLARFSTLFTTHLCDQNQARKIDWAIEAFFFVDVDLFREINGFDARFKRFHEGPDACLAIRRLGYQVWFTPDSIIKDHNQHSGGSWQRGYHWCRSLVIYFRKNPSRLLIYYFPRP